MIADGDLSLLASGIGLGRFGGLSVAKQPKLSSASTTESRFQLLATAQASFANPDAPMTGSALLFAPGQQWPH